MSKIEFNIPFTCDESANNIRFLIDNPTQVNRGNFTQKCKDWLEATYEGYTAYLTSSCTRAIEMAALSINLVPGDEIILSPFTYVGVGNALTIFGAKLVYVNLHPENMNINADLIEARITPKTKAIVAMHYASVGCEMDKIMDICKRHHLILIEDNAQGIQAMHEGRRLGTYGDFSCISFDLMKNISCHEGGVLLVNKEWEDKVDIVFENGTNRSAFKKGKVSAYEWIDRGSKFVLSEYNAAVLLPLLEKSADIVKARRANWDQLMSKIRAIDQLEGFIPKVMFDCKHNGHLAYLKFNSISQRDAVMNYMNENGVPSLFHYVSMDDSIAGKRFGDPKTIPTNAIYESNCLLRLPMHNHLNEEQMDRIVKTLAEAVQLVPAEY